MRKIIIILSVLALIAGGCKNRQPKTENDNSTKTEQDTSLQNSLVNPAEQGSELISLNLDGIADIDTFSTFPPEISGCACYFANNKTEFENEQYIFMYDFDKISFIKINGVLTKLIRVDDGMNISYGKLEFKNDNYEMEIELNKVEEAGYETAYMTGKIILKDKNGKTISKIMYGLCGC
jgi:hypothetical protein